MLKHNTAFKQVLRGTENRRPLVVCLPKLYKHSVGRLGETNCPASPQKTHELLHLGSIWTSAGESLLGLCSPVLCMH